MPWLQSIDVSHTNALITKHWRISHKYLVTKHCMSHANALITKHWRIWHKCPNYKALSCLTQMSWLQIFCSKSHTNILITKQSDCNRSIAVSHTNALITMHCHISHIYPNYKELRYLIHISWLQKHFHISHKCSDYKALPYLTCMPLTKALQ